MKYWLIFPFGLLAILLAGVTTGIVVAVTFVLAGSASYIEETIRKSTNESRN